MVGSKQHLWRKISLSTFWVKILHQDREGREGEKLSVYNSAREGWTRGCKVVGGTLWEGDDVHMELSGRGEWETKDKQWEKKWEKNN